MIRTDLAIPLRPLRRGNPKPETRSPNPVMSQNDTILSHLQAFGRITSLEAIRKYGITRLSARIYDLRDAGHNIPEPRMVTVPTRNGETQVAEYRLAKDGEQREMQF